MLAKTARRPIIRTGSASRLAPHRSNSADVIIRHDKIL
jgi:hypothetical protein